MSTVHRRQHINLIWSPGKRHSCTIVRCALNAWRITPNTSPLFNSSCTLQATPAPSLLTRQPPSLLTRQPRLLYNTLFSREENFAKSEFDIFSREDIFANILFTRKYLPAKISSRENILSRKYLPAKISSRENIFPRFVSVPQICSLVGLGYAVYRLFRNL